MAVFLGSVVTVMWDPWVREHGPAGAILIASTWFMMFGFVPAVLLGVLCGVLLRWRLIKAGC